jgi:hypothetical protein
VALAISEKQKLSIANPEKASKTQSKGCCGYGTRELQQREIKQ